MSDPKVSTPELPTEFTVGGRTYDVLSFLEGTESSVSGKVMLERGHAERASMDKEDGEHILKHAEEIPVALRGKIVLVFPEWRDPGSPEFVACLHWGGDRWIQDWRWLYWYGYRLVRRRT